MLLSVLFVAGLLMAQTPPQKISISMSSTGMPSIQLFIARERGFSRRRFRSAADSHERQRGDRCRRCGELDALARCSGARHHARRALRVVSVDLRRPIFWLVSRPEYRNAKDLKGKTLGIATINGSQHSAARKMLALRR
jgi:hypothetical protein